MTAKVHGSCQFSPSHLSCRQGPNFCGGRPPNYHAFNARPRPNDLERPRLELSWFAASASCRLEFFECVSLVEVEWVHSRRLHDGRHEPKAGEWFKRVLVRLAFQGL